MARHRVAKVGDMKVGDAHWVEISGSRIALFYTPEGYFALDAVCPHRGGPLVEGKIDAGQVVCPWHAWTFDLRTGACETTPSFRQAVYPVTVENGEIFVEL